MSFDFPRPRGALRALLLAAALLLGIGPPAAAAPAVIEGEYKLAAEIDPLVATELATELWAHVWRPAAAGTYPLLVFLHGNHSTCGHFDADLGVRVDDSTEYTITGQCGPGEVVTPNHMGYAYLAQPLAERGYVVVSINANRGVNGAPSVGGDRGLNLRRGRLVLRHLQQLADWNAHGGSPGSLGFSLQGLMDFDQVGLLGHSRGGEGMRAALAQYRDAGSAWPALIGPLGVRALFEIGPVDGQTSRVLNAAGVHWNVLLPGCDGDVSDFGGVRPFDRMLLLSTEQSPLRKSTVLVYGANHNFYNTEWQQSDAPWCRGGQQALFPSLGGSEAQRNTALWSVLPFFSAHVGANAKPQQGARFDPSIALPPPVEALTDYARGYTPTVEAAETLVIDNFDRDTGTSSRGAKNVAAGLKRYVHERASGVAHDLKQRVARVVWNGGGSLQVNAADAGRGIDASGFRALEFRVYVSCTGEVCKGPVRLDGDVDFSIQLVDASGAASVPITLKSRAAVRRPIGSFLTRPVLQTVRIPFAAFPGVDLARLQGVRFVFDREGPSSASIGNLRLSKAPAGDQVLPTGAAELVSAFEAATPETAPPDLANRIVALRRVAGGAAVEIELRSARRFPVGGALPELHIGERAFQWSRFAGHGTERIVFQLDAPAFDSLRSGQPVRLQIGGAPTWVFGALDKAALR